MFHREGGHKTWKLEKKGGEAGEEKGPSRYVDKQENRCEEGETGALKQSWMDHLSWIYIQESGEMLKGRVKESDGVLWELEYEIWPLFTGNNGFIYAC